MQFEPLSQHISHVEGQNFFDHDSSLEWRQNFFSLSFSDTLLHTFTWVRASRHVPGIEKHGNLYMKLSGIGIGDLTLALIRAFSSLAGLTHP